MAATDTITGLSECQLDISEAVRTAYLDYVAEYRRLRQLPSLAYLSGRLLICARNYVSAVQNELINIPAGNTLSSAQNDLLMLGCIIMNHDEKTIAMSPLHPLNVIYQLFLLQETGVGNVRDQLIEKLSALYLLPYIKDRDKNLYHAVEQRHSPEWRFYTPLTNKRYQGARNFVQTKGGKDLIFPPFFVTMTEHPIYKERLFKMIRKNTRRMLSVLLAAVLSAAMLSSCSNIQTTEEQPAASEEGAAAESDTAEQPQAGDETDAPAEETTGSDSEQSDSAAASSNILIAYFSVPETDGVDAVAGASRVVVDGEVLGNTQYIAQLIQQQTGGDLFRIETVQEYPGSHDPLLEFAYNERADSLAKAGTKKV